MAIVNRDLGVSQQRTDYHVQLTTAVAASAGVGYVVMNVPYPCQINAINYAANGISGTPSISVDIKRFVVGAGVTTLVTALGGTQAVLAYGTSGAFGMSLPAVSSTLMQLQTGDAIVVNQLFSGGNVAIGGMDFAIVLQALQDFKSQYNLTT